MSTVPSYLLLSRHSVFYFRIVVPEVIRPLFPRREIRRSLQTRCRREALIRGGIYETRGDSTLPDESKHNGSGLEPFTVEKHAEQIVQEGRTIRAIQRSQSPDGAGVVVFMGVSAVRFCPGLGLPSCLQRGTHGRCPEVIDCSLQYLT